MSSVHCKGFIVELIITLYRPILFAENDHDLPVFVEIRLKDMYKQSLLYIKIFQRVSVSTYGGQFYNAVLFM